MLMLSKHKDTLTLVARLIVGGIFVYAGWVKISDMATTIAFMGDMGITPFWAYVASYSEFIGGILIVLGFYSRVAAAVLSIVMLVAIYKSRSMGLQGFLAPLAVLASLVMLLGHGSGHGSLNKIIPEKGIQ